MLTIHTDEDIEGHAFGQGAKGGRRLAEAIVSVFKPEILGEDPIDREYLFQKLMRADRYSGHVPITAHGPVDVALWDITPVAACEWAAGMYFKAADFIHREAVDVGTPLMEVANIHAVCGIKNCQYLELPVGEVTFGLKEPIPIDSEGYVHAPQAPGLGWELDWDTLNEKTVDRL